MARLNPLRLSRLDDASRDKAFGGGRNLQSFGGGAGPEAYGAGLRIPQTTALAYGAGDAAALQAAGDIVSAGATVALRVQRRDEALRGASRLQSFRREAIERYRAREESAAPDAADFTKSTMEDFDAFVAQKVDGLEGEERRIVEEGLADYGTRIYQSAAAFEAETKRAYYKTTAQQMVEQARNAVFTDPEDFDREQATLLSAIEATGLPAPVKAELAQSAKSSLTESVWRRRVRDDPFGAAVILRDQEVENLSANDRLQLLAGAEGEMRRQLAEQEAAESRARSFRAEQRAIASAERSEARAAASEAREQLRAQREEAEADLTAGLLNGTRTLADVQAAVGSRLISGDQARTLTAFATNQRNLRTEPILAVGFMSRAAEGDTGVITEAAAAAQAGLISVDQLRQITNDVQEYQRQGGPFAREDFKLGEAQIKRVLEQDDGFGLDADKADKAFSALQMYRRYFKDDPSGDPLELATKVIDVWKQGAGRAPRPRYLVQPAGARPDFAASAQATIDAFNRGEIDAQEAMIQSDALEMFEREFDRKAKL